MSNLADRSTATTIPNAVIQAGKRSVQIFRDAAHGYVTTPETTNRDSRAHFGKVVKTALDCLLTTDHELKTIFGFTAKQIRAAKTGSPTRVDEKTRNSFLATMNRRARSFGAR